MRFRVRFVIDNHSFHMRFTVCVARPRIKRPIEEKICRQVGAAYAKAGHRLMIYRNSRPQMTQDQINLVVQRVLQDTLGEKLAREFEKMRSQTVTGAQVAKLLRDITSVTKEAE